MMTLEQKFECEIPEGEAEKLRTVRDVVNYIEKRKSEAKE
jgi:acyl carrier protein